MEMRTGLCLVGREAQSSICANEGEPEFPLSRKGGAKLTRRFRVPPYFDK
jgi:hypothetical protein